MSWLDDFWSWATKGAGLKLDDDSGLLGKNGGIKLGNTLGQIFSPAPGGIRDSIGLPTNPPAPVAPPNIIPNSYDEGSKFREARDQAALLNQGPSIGDIMSQLGLLGDYSRYMANPAELLKQAQAAASAQYDPVIASLRSQEGSAQNRANQNKVNLGAMFNQLSDSLGADIPQIQQNFDQTKQNTQQAYNDLGQQINNTYDQTQAEQEAMLKRLGIQAAAPDVMGQQAKDKDFFLSSAAREGQTAQTALDTESRGNQEYTRRGSELARTEGTQRQADLMSKLQDLMASYESQIGSNEAAKAQAIQAGLGQLTQQSQQQASTLAQRDFDNYLKQIELGRELKGDQLKLGQQGQVLKTQSPADVPGRALSLGLDQNSAQAIQNAFSNAVSSDPVILSGLDPTAGTAAPKEALAARVVQQGRQMGLNQAQLNALQTIALEYFGRV